MRKVVWESPVPAEAVLLAREAADVSETPREPAEPGVVDGCPARRRTPPLSPAASRRFYACVQLPSSSASVSVRHYLCCYFAEKGEGVTPGWHTLCLW